MTYYQPCLNCAADKSACTTRAAMRKAIKGLHLTSIKFNCGDRVARFHTGQRVSFDWRYFDEDGSGEGYTATFNGTIMHEKKGNKRFAIRVDQEGEFYDLLPKDILKSAEFVSVRPDDITLLEEPNKPLCRLCAAYDDANDMREKCWTRGDSCERGCMRDGRDD